MQHSAERVADIGVQVASALAVAHAAGIVHRDVKPANILSAPGGLVKLTDFGIAADLTGDASTLSQLLGTLQYLAPEVFNGAAANGASDQYSLAASLCALAAGRSPFPTASGGQGIGGLIRAKEMTTNQRLAESGVEDRLAAIIMRGMQPDPADRHASIEGFAQALMSHQAASGWPVTRYIGPGSAASQPAASAPAKAATAAPAPPPPPTPTPTPMPMPTAALMPPTPPPAPPPALAAATVLGTAHPDVRDGTVPTIASRIRRSPWLAVTAGAIAVVFAVVVFIVVRDNDPSGSENGSSTGLTLNSPVGLAVADDGSVVVADDANHRIVMLDESGAVSGLITDPEGQSVEGVSEVVTPLDSPVGVATHGEVLYIADAQAHRVVAVDPDGTVRSVAGPGDGTVGSGDGGPAIYATLGLPSRLAASPDGALFVSDVETHGVRLIGTDEVMSRFAGGDEPGFAGDGGLAVDALLNSPGGMAVAGGGILYIADTLNHRIRAVDTNSVITTVAGTGAQDFSGDDGPAIEAELGAPNDVAIGPDGSLYIADSSNHRIRRIGSDGTITTVAGTGSSGYSGDGGPAIEAELNNPVAIAVDLNGNLYITDGQNQCIRKVSAEGVITTILG